MNHDLNIATRRLLQVVLDMLTNQGFDKAMAEREATKAKGERVYDPPSRFRCDYLAVEAAWRAAREAHSMLLDKTIADQLNPAVIHGSCILTSPDATPEDRARCASRTSQAVTP